MGEERLAFIRKLVKERGLNEKDVDDLEFVEFTDEKTCLIQEGVLLGMDGFGYEQNEDGEYEKFPHYGKVIIGPFVDIYSGTSVQRGTLGDTIISRGTKISGHCRIGHGSLIGEDCLVGSFSIICGSAVLGDNVKTGEYVRVAPHVKVGNNVNISSYTNVTKDVPNNSHVRGNPGKLI